MGGSLGDKWIYNGLPWYSLAIGYNFVSVFDKKAENQAKKQNELKTQSESILRNRLGLEKAKLEGARQALKSQVQID